MVRRCRPISPETCPLCAHYKLFIFHSTKNPLILSESWVPGDVDRILSTVMWTHLDNDDEIDIAVKGGLCIGLTHWAMLLRFQNLVCWRQWFYCKLWCDLISTILGLIQYLRNFIFYYLQSASHLLQIDNQETYL